MSKTSFKALAAAYVSALSKTHDPVLEMREAEQMLGSCHELRTFVGDPSTRTDDIIQALKSALPAASTETIHTLAILGSQASIKELRRFMLHVQEETAAQRGIRYATASTAIPMNGKEKEKLENILKTKLQAEIRIRYNVDASLIGGLRLSIGDIEFDASVRGRVRRLQRHIEMT